MIAPAWVPGHHVRGPVVSHRAKWSRGRPCLDVGRRGDRRQSAWHTVVPWYQCERRPIASAPRRRDGQQLHGLLHTRQHWRSAGPLDACPQRFGVPVAQQHDGAADVESVNTCAGMPPVSNTEIAKTRAEPVTCRFATALAWPTGLRAVRQQRAPRKAVVLLIYPMTSRSSSPGSASMASEPSRAPCRRRVSDVAAGRH